jgi:hypothetical protein
VNRAPFRASAVITGALVLMGAVGLSARFGPRLHVATAWNRSPASGLAVTSVPAGRGDDSMSSLPRAATTTRKPAGSRRETKSSSNVALGLESRRSPGRPTLVGPLGQIDHVPASEPPATKVREAHASETASHHVPISIPDEPADTQTSLLVTSAVVRTGSPDILPATEHFEPGAPPRPESPSPWQRTADAGESIGRGAANAGVKTAGFFTGMGRAIVGSF